MLAHIAVHTENLKALRKARLPEPLVESHPTSAVFAGLPHFSTVIVDMVDAEKLRFRLTTTAAYIAAIGIKNIPFKYCI